MSRRVQPKKISPLIKGARYTFLLAGWLYGVNKRAFYMAIERKQAPLRKAALEEERKQAKALGKLRSIDELNLLFKDMGIEPDPGWEGSL